LFFSLRYAATTMVASELRVLKNVTIAYSRTVLGMKVVTNSTDAALA